MNYKQVAQILEDSNERIRTYITRTNNIAKRVKIVCDNEMGLLSVGEQVKQLSSLMDEFSENQRNMGGVMLEVIDVYKDVNGGREE